MSNNPQWKSFQPPLIMNSDSLLEYKSMASPLSINDRNSGPMMNGPSYNSNSVNHFQQQPYHSFILDKNGSNNDFSSSTSNFSASNYNSSFNQSSNLMARKKRPPMSMDIFNGDSVSLSSNTSNSGYNNVNQVTRETGIIEKLLVSVSQTFTLYLLCMLHITLLHYTCIQDEALFKIFSNFFSSWNHFWKARQVLSFNSFLVYRRNFWFNHLILYQNLVEHHLQNLGKPLAVEAGMERF